MSRVARIVSQPWTPTRVGDEILRALGEGYTSLVATVGFANASGVRHVAAALEAFRANGGQARFVVGVDGSITSEAGVRALVRVTDEVWLFRHPGRPLFHPKTYLFERADAAVALIGSANLTESALWVNYEDLAVIELDPAHGADQSAIAWIRQSYDKATSSPNAHLADDSVLARVKAMGLLPSEAARRRGQHREDVEVAKTAAKQDATSGDEPLFPHSAVPAAPAVPALPEEIQDAEANPPTDDDATAKGPGEGDDTGPFVPPVVAPQGAKSTTFVMRLGSRDTETKAGFSPDVFIPLAAYRADPSFWGNVDPDHNPERYAAIEFRRISGSIERESRRLYFYDVKSEFRLSSRQVHADSVDGDLLALELAPPGIGVEYVARVIKPSDPLSSTYDAIASNQVPNSPKRWGYA